jgi:hypothetical protein
MADISIVRWQNKTIAATSDFRGPLIMALPVAALWFLWQWLSLPGLLPVQADLPPLLRFALAKGRYMPDFGLIIAGFAAFHFERGLKLEWDRAVATRLYLRLLAPLLAYLLCALILFELVALLGLAHRLALPWSPSLVAPAFWIMVTMVLALILLPGLLYWTWTCIPDICWAGIAICFSAYGISFQEGFHQYLWLWPIDALVDFAMGVFLCASLFRGVEYLSAVRGPAIILGWVALLAGAILEGPALFFIGFVMILSGMAVGERSWYLIGERGVLAWSRTALAFALVQPAVLLAWMQWGPQTLRPLWLQALLLALVIQVLAVVLYGLVMGVLTPLVRRSLAPPAG